MDFLRRRYLCDSEPLRSERRLELVLLVLAAVAALQLLWMGVRLLLPPGLAPVPPAADSLRIAAVPGQPPLTAEQRLELQARPPFWESRRPLDLPSVSETVRTDDSATTKAEAAAPRLEGLALRGLFAGGEQAGAIVSYRGKEMRLLEGDELAGWVLARVGSNEAVFRSGVEEDARQLQRQSVPGAGSAARVDAGRAAAEEPAASRPVAPAGPRSLSSGGLSTGGVPPGSKQ
jgi:hypothetical protein